MITMAAMPEVVCIGEEGGLTITFTVMPMSVATRRLVLLPSVSKTILVPVITDCPADLSP